MSLSGPGLWYATRAAGIVTLVLLTGTTALAEVRRHRAAQEHLPAGSGLPGPAHRHDSDRHLHLDRHSGCRHPLPIRLSPAVARPGGHRVGPAHCLVGDQRAALPHRPPALAARALVWLPVLARSHGPWPRDRHGP